MDALLGTAVAFVVVVALSLVVVLLLRGAFVTVERGKRQLRRRTMTTTESVAELSQRLSAGGWHPNGSPSPHGDLLLSCGPLRITVSPSTTHGSTASFLGLTCPARTAEDLEQALDQVFLAHEST